MASRRMVTTASLRTFPRSNTFASISSLLPRVVAVEFCGRGQRGTRRGAHDGREDRDGLARAGARFARPPQRHEVPGGPQERPGGADSVVGGQEGGRDGGAGAGG